jgi:hypothetical protein
MFPTERHEVQLLSEPGFGSAYTAYTRYVTVQKVCDVLGLNMQSQLVVTLAGMMRKDVIHWTGAKEGTFANNRKDIKRSEELHLRLGRAFSLTAAEASLKYEKLNWVILELGKLSANQNTQLLKMALFTSRDITGSALSVLMRKIGMTMKNPIDDVPLLFIGMIDLLFDVCSF